MKTIDPKKVIITFFGRHLTGYADGEYIGIEFPESFTKVVGADGEVARVKSNDESGEVTLTLLQTSASNGDLSKIALADKITGLGVGPFSMTDLQGGTLVAAAEAWIAKKPKIGYSKSGETRAWTIHLANATWNIEGL